MSVDSIPIVDISDTTATGEAPFGYVSGATVLSDGGIAISDGYAAAVLFYDAAGKHLRTVGRRGSGPGEFEAVWWLGQCGIDSVFVWDYMHRAMTVLDRTGDIIRRYTPQSNPGLLSCSRNGRFVALVPPYTAPAGEPFPHESARLLLMDNLGDSLRTLGVFPAWEQRVLGKMTQLAITDERVFVGTADSAAVDVLSLDGRESNTVVVGDGDARLPSDANYDAALESMVVKLVERDVREQWRAVARKTMPPPEFLPHYSALLVDSADVLWVVLSVPGDDSTRLRAIDPEGSILGDVTIPRDLRTFEIGADYILGTYEDGRGFQHVVVYRLHRVAGAIPRSSH